ncbi:hypothetical protein CTAYLR_000328 [Chrysophaeum taylorii]|uniref:Choline monooxygenase, chloroplastic n=1 Tax=Chrysophaeum taylorii TaxID=2483200 RepID=A0AAD7XJ25_9STRA|nr:hypothetical protein CTAYLR_000328 [Chrysophaeum taylorii]
MLLERVVVVGGGVAGVSIARELARAGVRVKLFERSKQLCAGATWHAAGLVTRFAGSSKLKKLHVRSLQLLSEIHEKTEGGIGLHLSGSIRLVKAGDRDRALEARRHVELAKLYDEADAPTTLVTPAEIKALHPLVDTSHLELGVRTVRDGDVDPTLLANALAVDAKNAGATVVLGAEVSGVEKLATGEFRVSFDSNGSRPPEVCDAVVNATGLWSQRLSEQMGLGATHPAFVIEHHYAVTEPLPALAALRAKGERVPVLRDLAGSSYLRQEQDGILVGPYERLPPEAVHREWRREGPPMSWAWDLFPDKVDRLEEVMAHAMEYTMPALQEVGLASVVNGPTIWAPDSLPRCGRTRIPGYYDFNTLTYGIAHSMPLAEHLKTLMLDGEQPYDLAAECDPLRYGRWANDDYAAAKIAETYRMNNKPAYAFENRKAGRDVPHVHASEALATLAKVLKKHGALTSFSQGVETPLAFLPPTVQVVEEARFDNHEWAEAARREAEHVRASVGVGCATGFSKLVVRSRDDDGTAARALLADATTNVVPKTPGACRLTYAVAPKRGSVVAEFTVSNLTGCGLLSGDDATCYYVVGSRDYAGHDLEWLKTRARALGYDSSVVEIADVSTDIEILLLAGPDSKKTLLGLLDDDDAAAVVDSLGFLKFATRPVRVAGVEGVVIARVSFTGEAGYELHAPAESAASLFDAIVVSAGVEPFGSHATNSLRLEKGFKVKADLDFARFDEAGISAFTRKSFVRPPIDTPPARRAALFKIRAAPGFEWSVPGDSPIFSAAAGDKLVGFTTSSAFGTEANATLAAGFLLQPDTPTDLRVECFGMRWPCEILESPPAPVRGFDHKPPEMRRDLQHERPMPLAAQQRLLSTTAAPPSETVVPDEGRSSRPLAWTREEYFSGSRRSFEHASCFGGTMYTDEQIHADERRAIFRREWVIVGHASDLSKPGDVVPFEIAGAPLFAVNHKGTIKAYHNVCRHRGAKLVDRSMKNRAVISCPYHKWGYALDGRLVGTPCWDEVLPQNSADDRQLPRGLKEKFDTAHVANFDRKDFGLFPCDLKTWGGMLWARVGDRDGKGNVDLEAHLGDLPIQLRNYPLDEMVVARQITVDRINANWKILAENFSEYYHLPAVHPELCAVSGVDEHVRTQGAGKYLGFATAPLTNGGTAVDPVVAPPMPGLEGTPDAFAARHVMIYPSAFMSFYPHHVFRVILEPLSAGVTRERTHLVVHPKIYDDLGDERAEQTIDRFMAFHQKVNNEDMSICEAVQRGVMAPPYAGGRLSFRFEETIHRFQNLVADSLVGSGHRIPPADDDFDAFRDLEGPPAP